MALIKTLPNPHSYQECRTRRPKERYPGCRRMAQGLSAQCSWSPSQTGGKPQGPQQIRCCTSVQDGINSDSEVPHQTGGLATKARSEGRLPVGPNPSRPQEVPPLPLAGSDMGVQNLAIRLEQCALDVHEAHEANCLNVTSTRDTNDHLFRRCAPDGRQCSGIQNTLEGGTRDPSCTGIRYQHKEECISTNPEAGLPGVCQ